MVYNKIKIMKMKILGSILCGLTILIFLDVAVISVLVSAQTTPPPTQITNPLAKGGVDSIPSLITQILKIVARLGAIVCALFIIYSGFLFIKAQGNPEALNKAKSVFMWSCIGTAVLLGASVMANMICNTVASVVGGSGGEAFTCPK
jgi:hypothetical protein